MFLCVISYFLILVIDGNILFDKRFKKLIIKMKINFVRGVFLGDSIERKFAKGNTR